MADDRLIPPSVNDLSGQAYNAMAERLGQFDLTVLLIYLVDQAPAGVLPFLAEQFHVQGNEGWSLVDSDTARRELIKRAIDLHLYKGTEYALSRAIDILGLTYRIEKWWEYDGAPFHFRVNIDLLDSGISPAQQALLSAFVDEYKALRDVQDPMIFNLAATGSAFAGVSYHSSEIVTVYPQN